MEEKIVIHGLTSGGYWCSSSKAFRGIIFATLYENNNSAYDDLEDACKQDYCEVVAIYPKQPK